MAAPKLLGATYRRRDKPTADRPASGAIVMALLVNCSAVRLLSGLSRDSAENENLRDLNEEVAGSATRHPLREGHRRRHCFGAARTASIAHG